MVRYYNNPDRGTLKPIKTPTGETMRQDPTTKHIGTSKGVWRSNSFSLNSINKFKPMLSRDPTPRGTLRQISLDRNYSREKWLYNKKQLEDFEPARSKTDMERSKALRKLSKR